MAPSFGRFALGFKNRQGNIAMPFGPDPALTQYRLRALSKKPTHYPF